MTNTPDGATHAQIYNKDNPTEVIELSDIKEELDYIGEQRGEEGKQFNNPSLFKLRELSGLTQDTFSKYLIEVSETKGLENVVSTFNINATIPDLSIEEFLGFIGLNAEVVGADGLLAAYQELDNTTDESKQIEIAEQIKEDIPTILINLKQEIITSFENHAKLFAENYTGGKFKLGRGGSTKAKKALEALSEKRILIEE